MVHGDGTNDIHPSAHLIGDVILGHGNVVQAGAILIGPLRVGDDNVFGFHAVVGSPGQDETLRGHLTDSTSRVHGDLVIGDRNVFRESSIVNRGLTGETVVGNDAYVMAAARIGHDVVVADGVKIGSGVQVGGYCWIGRRTYLGQSCSLHPFSVIGGVTMVGMGTVLPRREIPPGSVVFGNPGRIVRPNMIGLERIGVTATEWWDEAVRGEDGVRVPPQLQGDMHAYQTACARAAEQRGNSDAVRGERLRAQGSIPSNRAPDTPEH